jgi:hypothetical protein
MHTFGPRHDRSLITQFTQELLMENNPMVEEGPESLCQDGLKGSPEEFVEATEEEAVGTRSDTSTDETVWHYEGGEPTLLDAGFTLELRNIKTAMVIAPNHPIPVAVEGLLLEHHEMPLASEMELILSADDREIVRERFFLPSTKRAEIMDAHRELAKMSSDFLTDSRLRDKAMSVYFPELADKYDLWYKIGISDQGTLDYAVHLGPSHNQEVKKRIEGSLQL